ncbi:MAG: V-type ATP synthase subunit D [Gammaproteobacteria bacterium]|jgi:V/A-type H+-transporting ATPase subunit D
MARLALNKASLSKQSRQLKTFERFLPSLDLKRRQLMAERARERIAIQRTRRASEALHESVAAQIPMLANREIDLSELVKVKAVRLGEHNVVGIHLPTLDGIEVQVRDYGYLSRPHWVDRVAEELSRMLELRVQLAVQERRAALLDDAVHKVTQRVNLFEKVLIPRTREHIRRIRIYLADAERAAVVRSKIAKRKRAAAGMV